MQGKGNETSVKELILRHGSSLSSLPTPKKSTVGPNLSRAFLCKLNTDMLIATTAYRIKYYYYYYYY
jgi:hypothetical protein